MTRVADRALRRRLLFEALQVGDLLVMAVAFATGFTLSASLTGTELSEFLSLRIKLVNALVFVAFSCAWHVIFQTQGLYRSRRLSSVFSEWWDVAKAVTLGTLLLAALALFADLEAVSRSFLVTFFTIALGGTLVMRSALRLLLEEVRRRGRNLRKVVIVGSGPRGAYLGSEIRQRPDLGYLLLGYIDDIEPPRSPAHSGKEKHLGSLAEGPTVLRELEVDEVMIALPVKSYYDAIAKIIATSEELGLIVRMPADFFKVNVARADVDYFDRIPIVTLKTPTPNSGALLLKRMIDLVITLPAVVLLSPLFLLIALAIRVDSKGPAFFRQSRVGHGRRAFKMLKFRTMVIDAEQQQSSLESANEVTGAAFKMSNDPRITRIGRWLRRFSLDELPQLWNVVRGDMSLVGPRPLPLRDVDRFASVWQQRRFTVKPGLTCLWQANGRHELGFDEWMELDLQYIDQWSLGLDFEILMRTVPAVLRGTGAS